VLGGLDEAIKINYFSVAERGALAEHLAARADTDYVEGMQTATAAGRPRFRPVDSRY